ncbi:TolC family protein [Tenuifilum thalassicum]|uniref:TolC family protein n=1 Tax=Tenuifilum thalassicum TaxID=2590900 RepID=A0A7D4AWD8_9BACT|nr:TolC family protein [Tenuifilum thalassicum]QKG79314.1 TolC family protein [Tenuifilum thalassicum]
MHRLLLLFTVTGGIFLTGSRGYAQPDTLRLSVAQAVDLAVQQNLMQKVSELELQKKQEKVKEYMAALYPTIKASGSYTRNLKLPVIFMPAGSPFGPTLTIGSDNSYSASVSASMPLFVYNIFESIKLGQKDVAISQEKLRESKIDLAANIKKTYYNILLLKNSLNVINQSYKNALANLENIKKLNERGMVSDYDLIRIKVQVDNLYPNVLQAENTYKNLLNVLKVLLNIDVETPVVLNEDEIGEYSFTNLVLPDSSWVNNNTSLRQLSLTSEMLKIQEKMAKGANYPSLVAIGNYQYQTQANDFKFGDYRWVPTSMVGLQLNIPIFSGFSVRRQLNQVRISQKQIELQKEFTLNNLTAQVHNAINAVNTAASKVIAAQSNIEMAQKGYDIAKTRYNTGQSTLLELNDAENALLQARLNLIQAQMEYLIAKIDYEKIVGEVI